MSTFVQLITIGGMSLFDKINNPNQFQGNLKKKNYFEGWYYKQVTADQQTSLSFIPGVSLNKQDSHSFIQYILVETDRTGKKITQTGYIRYGVDEFHVQNDPFKVQIGTSTFTEDRIYIDLEDSQFTFQGEIKLGAFHPIKCSKIQPNIMGPFAYIPKMQCYHGVISMMHELTGSLKVNDKDLNFTNGRGYIEKDWGNSFPKQYVWLHSNHFNHSEASLFFSVAHIPFYFTEFDGFICNFVLGNQEYRFATYNQSTCTIEEIGTNHVTIRLENKKARLDLHAKVLSQGKLIAPVEGKMDKTIKEGISGIIHLRLENKETGQVFEDTGLNAGVEIVDYH